MLAVRWPPSFVRTVLQAWRISSACPRSALSAGEVAQDGLCAADCRQRRCTPLRAHRTAGLVDFQHLLAIVLRAGGAVLLGLHDAHRRQQHGTHRRAQRAAGLVVFQHLLEDREVASPLHQRSLHRCPAPWCPVPMW